MDHNKRHYKILFFFLIPIFFACSCQPAVKELENQNGQITLSEAELSEDETAPEIIVPEPDQLIIIAVGDNLFHNVMIRQGEQGNYDPIYSEIRSLVQKADIAFINQETLLGGIDYGFSGYPLFNSPQELGRAVTAAGFNVVNHATNHSMDKGERAVFATMDFWDTMPQITVLGIHRSAEQRSEPKLIQKNNFTLGFLAFTYGTNGIPLPAGRPYLISLINTTTMAREIDALRPLCDFLIVSMHWGEEYTHNYTSTQKTLAVFLAEHKVDLVIGHHPHVVQPIEYIMRPDGRFMLCYYSLGNLISAQSMDPTLLGAMAYIKLEKPPDPQTGITFIDAGAIPLVTHYDRNFSNFKVYPLYAYTEELLKQHWKNRVDTGITLEYLTGIGTTIFGNKNIMRSPFE
ncbi:MAG: CapA family protein [Treponema sp.]|jgi:poly-gamma-glutamate synthesis protein (capsule biosynthesis protein)|nr:CapA family protein [Treponema sp.]